MARLAAVGQSWSMVPATHTLSDQRSQLKHAAEMRLSGATLETPLTCGTANLKVASFSRVTMFEFTPDGPVEQRAGRRVEDDDVDW